MQIYSFWHKRSWKDRPPPSPGASLSALTTAWVITRLREWMRTQAISSWQLHTGPIASASGRDKERERPRVHSMCWAVSLCPAVPLSTSLQPGWPLWNASTKLLPSRSLLSWSRGDASRRQEVRKRNTWYLFLQLLPSRLVFPWIGPPFCGVAFLCATVTGVSGFFWQSSFLRGVHTWRQCRFPAMSALGRVTTFVSFTSCQLFFKLCSVVPTSF